MCGCSDGVLSSGENFCRVSVAPGNVVGMKQRDLFLMSDAALRDVIDMLDLDQLRTSVPAAWGRAPQSTLREILAAHAHDEAWVPDLLAGRTAAQVGERWLGDLLGDDPIGSYDELNDAAAEAAMRDDLEAQQIVHFSYGDYALAEGFIHLSVYRALQAWSIAHLVCLDYDLPDALVDLLWELLLPRIDEYRRYGIFPAEVVVPQGSDRQTQLLGKTGFLVP